MIDYVLLIKHELDMLNGNINRICITKDVDEIEKMYEVALFRLEKIKDFRIRRINAIEKRNN